MKIIVKNKLKLLIFASSERAFRVIKLNGIFSNVCGDLISYIAFTVFLEVLIREILDIL